MKIIEFDDFEKVVMQRLLEGDDPILEILRKQYENAQIIERRFTGVGFFTEYSVTENIARLDNPKNFEIGDISGNINDVFVTFILFIRNGVIDFLEGCTFGEPWPEPIYSYDLVYTIQNGKGTSKQRDMETLRAELEERKKAIQKKNKSN